ncbi:MAG: DUF86 domain-containing protein [Amphiplicatus sp.]
MPSSNPALRLRDIAENIRAIFEYVKGMDRAAFLADRKTQDAVERCLLRLSEAAIKLGPYAEETFPGHDWAGARAIGNVLRHAYDEVDPVILWTVIESSLPSLLGDIEKAISDL